MNYELGVGVKNGPNLPGYDYVPWRLTQSNHGGIVEYHGQEYLFYHTSALSSWRQDRFQGPGTWTQRSGCIDELIYRKDGSIVPVKQTIEGVAAVKINQPALVNLSLKQASLAEDESESVSIVYFVTCYYYFSAEVSGVTAPLKIEVRTGSADGKLLGTLLVKKDGYVDTSLIDANGKQTIFLKAVGGNVQISACRFFAGNVE